MKKIVPDPKQLEVYLERGLTQAQIVDEWEKDSGGIRCSRSAIAMAMDRYGLKGKRTQTRYTDLVPWHPVAPEHRMHHDLRLLRLEGRRRRGASLSEGDLRRLSHWLEELKAKDAVIHYDRHTKRGFWWVPRQEGDEDIIRRPKERTPLPVA